MGKREKRDKGRKSVTTTPGPSAVRHSFSYGGLLGHDLTGSPWSVNVSEMAAAGLDVVMACIKIIADGVAGSDVGQWNGVQRVQPESGFTLRPDPDLTRREFLWLFTANLALYDAVWLEEASVGGQVIGVRLHCITTVTSVGSQLYVNGKPVTNRMKLVRRSLWPTLDLESSATINLARELLAGTMASNAYASDFWQQGGAPTVVLTTDQDITGDQADGIADRWVDKRTTSPGRPAVLGKGAHAAEFGANLGTAGAHTASDKQKAAIARHFVMPPGIVNVLSEAGPLTYSTVEQESIHLVRYTIQPYCDVEGEALSSYLPGDYLLGDRIVIDPSRLMMADQFTRFQSWDIATGRVGWMDPEEVRAREHLPPGAPQREVANVPA